MRGVGRSPTGERPTPRIADSGSAANMLLWEHDWPNGDTLEDDRAPGVDGIEAQPADRAARGFGWYKEVVAPGSVIRRQRVGLRALFSPPGVVRRCPEQL